MIKIKSFRQTSGYCGPASLKMVLEYYGVHKSEGALAKLSGATRSRGVDAKRLLRTVTKLGFRGLVKDYSSIEDIKRYIKQNIPVIVDWFSQDDGHYSVAVGLDRQFIYLQDPEIGKIRKLNLEVFKCVWFDFSGKFPHPRKGIIIRRIIVIKENERFPKVIPPSSPLL
jgi:ABC-type bacteriocin/lantibiotic exporter with double-glycine peptidase domain